MKKGRILLALVMAVTLTFASCGQKAEETKKEENPLEKVATLYEEQIKECDKIDFAIDDAGVENPSYEYKYAFAYMDDDEIPELIIQKIDKSFGLEYNKVFYYDKENDKLLSPSETIATGVTSIGGFRGGLAASNNKDGIILNQGSSGNGKFEIIRVNLQIKEDGTAVLKNTKIKDYILGTENVDDGESVEIIWYEVKDLSPLEDLKAGKIDLNKSKEEQKPATKDSEKSKKDMGAKVDNKTVFQGTLKYLSYNEVLKLQGIQDPNSGYADTSEKFALLVFDKKISITAISGDGQGSHAGEAKMIELDNLKNPSKYNGKKIKVKITEMIWPSDTGLPLGEPRAMNGNYKIVK